MQVLGVISFCLVLSAVFIVDKNIQNGIVYGKYFWFFLAIAIASPFVLYSYLQNKQPIKITAVDVFITIFCVIGFVTSYISSNFGSTPVVLLLLCLVLYFYLRIFLQQKKINYWLVCFFIITGITEALWGYLQFKGLVVRNHPGIHPSGTFFNPGPYGGYLSMVLPMALYYCLRDFRAFKVKFDKRITPFIMRWIISLFACISILYILPISNSRASWLAALISCIFVIVGFVFKVTKTTFLSVFKSHKIIFIVIFFITFIALGFVVNHLYGIRKGSSDARALIWKISLSHIPKNATGVGVGNYLGVYGDAHIDYFKSGEATRSDKNLSIITLASYNEYITICIEYGILGLFFYLLAIGGAIYRGSKNKQFAAPGSLLSLSVFASMSYPYTILPFVISVAFLLAFCITNYSYSIPKKGTTRTGVLIIVLCIIAVFVLANRYHFFGAYNRWEYIKKNPVEFESLVDEYAKLEPYLGSDEHFLTDYALRESRMENYQKSISILEKAKKISANYGIWFALAENYKQMENYSVAEEYILSGAKLVPRDTSHYYTLVNLYIEANEFEKAQKMIEIIRKSTPASQIIKVYEDRIRMKKDKNKAASK